jgi:hypothetical protein
MGENIIDTVDIARVAHEIYFKIILFIVIVLVFLSFIVLLMYLIIKKYPIEYIMACAGSETLIGVLMKVLTRSLFKAPK